MSRTMVLHVRYKSLYISLPLSSKQHREMTDSPLALECELRRLPFLKFYFKFISVSKIAFVIALTVIKKLKDLRVSRDSWVKYKFIF